MSNGNLESILSELSNQINDVRTGISALDIKIEAVENRLETKIEALRTEMNDVKIGMVKLEEKINGSTATLEDKINGSVAVLEEKINGSAATLDAKLSGIDNGMSNEEFVSRGAFVTLIGGAVAGFVKYFFFSNSQ